MIKKIVVMLVVVLVMPVVAQENEVTVCTHDSSVRKIGIEYEEPNQLVPCKVTYEKMGQKEILWFANQQIGYCEEKAKAFVEKQVGWGWSCEKEEKSEDTAEESVEEAPAEETE